MQITYCPYRSQFSLESRKVFVTLASSSEQDTSEKQVGKPSSPASPQKATTIPRKNRVSQKGEKIKKDLDKIMDEIDEVLEENAEEFIKSYVQRGGE